MEPVMLILELVPEEAASVEEVAAAGELLDETRQAMVAQGYQAQPVSLGMRGDMIQIAFDLARQVVDHQLALGTLLTAAITTLTTLSKHRRIGKIELKQGSETVVIEDVDRAEAERLLQVFAQRTKASNAPVRVKATVGSARKKP